MPSTFDPSSPESSPGARTGAARRDEDFVHAALVEVMARRLRGQGFPVAIDEPYQHYQFAGRADVVAWDPGRPALLHIEARTRFPNVQEALGSFASKRAYLGAILAERFNIDGRRWASETHVVAALWSSEVVHVLRLRETTFRAACPGSRAAFDDWWAGRAPASGRSSVLMVLDPRPEARDRTRLGSLDDALRVRPRVRDYAEAARLLRSR